MFEIVEQRAEEGDHVARQLDGPAQLSNGMTDGACAWLRLVLDFAPLLALVL